MAAQRPYPYKITPLDDEINRTLINDFTGYQDGHVQVGPKKYIFPSSFSKFAEEFYNFEVRNDDVWIVTFPRSGTTWTQEMTWLLCNNFDYEQASRVELVHRSQFLEYCIFMHPNVQQQLLDANQSDPNKVEEIQNMVDQMQELRNCTGRRFIKSHLPFSLLPPELFTSGCKVIYVARNPKDVAVSFYYHNRLFRNHDYTNTWQTYWEYFSNNLIPCTPYWEHIKEGFAQKDNPNVLFLFYEDMNRDLATSLQKMASFLNVSLSAEELRKLQTHLHIDNLRESKAANLDKSTLEGLFNPGEQGFIRQGKTGASEAYFTGATRDSYDKWIADNKKHVLDLTFPL